MATEFITNGILLHNHICGNIVSFSGDIIGTRTQVLEIDHNSDKQKEKSAARHKTTLLGPMETSSWPEGTLQSVNDAYGEACASMDTASVFSLGSG